MLINIYLGWNAPHTILLHHSPPNLQNSNIFQEITQKSPLFNTYPNNFSLLTTRLLVSEETSKFKIRTDYRLCT